MIALRLRHRFERTTLDIDFNTPTPGTTVLFGPSGAGKSSIVLAIAGLLRADHTYVSVDGVVLADTDTHFFMPPEQRRIGVVFQDARLFPHMDVQANLRYGLRRAPAGPIRFDDVVALLGIKALLCRRPHTLSGGERQRVAIGRALLSQPRLLLMDEPLAGLDTPRKAEILPYLVRLKTMAALPIIYVTHALDELTRLADTVVLLEQGRAVVTGPLSDIAVRTGLSLAARDDAAAILTLRVSSHDPVRRLTLLEADGISLLVPMLNAATPTVRVRIPAREVILASAVPATISVHNVLQGVVRAVSQDHGRHQALVEITIGTATVLARVTADAVERLALTPGAPVLALVKSISIDILDA